VLTTILVIVAVVVVGRFLLRGLARVRATTATVKANSHWIWIGAAVLLALSFAARH
jgi:hypothetical protein